VDISKPSRNFELSSLFAVANGGAVVAATAATARMVYLGFLHGTSNPPWLLYASLMFFLFMGIVLYGIALLFPSVLFRLLRPLAPSNAVVWMYFPFFGGAVGYALPFVAGLLFPLPPQWSAAFGLLGGISCAWFWLYAEKHPSALAMNLDRRYELRPQSRWLLVIGAVIVIVAIIETSWTR
jgi:hypothetical protein